MKFLALFALAAVLPAQADQLFQKDGTILSGALKRADVAGVVFHVAGDPAPRSVPWGALAVPAIRTAGPFTLGLSNGDRITARLSGVEGTSLRLESAVVGVITLPLSALEAPAPAPAEPAAAAKAEASGSGVEEEVDGALKVFDPTPWKGKVGLSGLLQSGNVDALLVRFDAALEKFWRVNHFKAAASLVYGETNGDLTASAGRIGGKFDHYYSKKFYTYANAEAGYDEVQNIDLRALLGAGVGYEFWKEGNDRAFGVEAGIAALYESFAGGGDHLSPTGRAALFYRDVYFEKLKFEQLAEILVPLDDPGRFIVRSFTGVSMPLAEAWSLKNTLEITFEGDPPINTESTDIKLFVGIEYSF